MLNKKIKMKTSPLTRQREMRTPRGSNNMQALVSDELHLELMFYIRNYNKEHDVPKKNNKETTSQALRHIFSDFLNTHCIDKQPFENLNALMLVSKDKHDCELIGFIDNADFKQDLFKYKKLIINQYNYIYTLAELNKDNYDSLNLSEMTEPVLFDISRETQKNFDEVKEILQNKYDFDINEAYFVAFNLNNYLDIIKDGVYVSKNSTYSHEGVVVLFDPLSNEKVCLRMVWGFNGGEFDLQIHVEEQEHFDIDIINSIREYDIIKEYFTVIGEIEPTKEELEDSLEHYQDIRRKIDNKIDEKLQALSKYK